MVRVETGRRSGGLGLGPLTGFSLPLHRTDRGPEKPATWSCMWSQTAQRCSGGLGEGGQRGCRPQAAG